MKLPRSISMTERVGLRSLLLLALGAGCAGEIMHEAENVTPQDPSRPDAGQRPVTPTVTVDGAAAAVPSDPVPPRQCAVPGGIGPAPLRRLTVRELNWTFRDLLGDASNPLAEGERDDGPGFHNDIGGLGVSSTVL